MNIVYFKEKGLFVPLVHLVPLFKTFVLKQYDFLKHMTR